MMDIYDHKGNAILYPMSLPWEARKQGNGGYTICRPRSRTNQADITDVLYDQPYISEENANFIVLAANNHEALVYALREALNQLATNYAYGREKGIHYSNERVNMTSAAQLIGKKALENLGVKS